MIKTFYTDINMYTWNWKYFLFIFQNFRIAILNKIIFTKKKKDKNKNEERKKRSFLFLEIRNSIKYNL